MFYASSCSPQNDGIAQVTSAKDGVPANHIHRPVITGWFAEFATLNKQRSDEQGRLWSGALGIRRLDLRSNKSLSCCVRFQVLSRATAYRYSTSQYQSTAIEDAQRWHLQTQHFSGTHLALPPQPLEDLAACFHCKPT